MPQLFSYGTLQQEEVQLLTFGRKLDGRQDRLMGFEQTLVEIKDRHVVEASGKTHHPIIAFTGRDADQVSGTVFEITDQELVHADAYEVDDYRRVAVTLGSGVQAWVYVDARFVPSASPSAATIEAMKESECGALPTFHSVEALMADLNLED